MFDLKKKIIIVTGGSGLLGSIIVKTIKENNGIPIILDIKTKRSKDIFLKLILHLREKLKNESRNS